MASSHRSPGAGASGQDSIQLRGDWGRNTESEKGQSEASVGHRLQAAEHNG
jgi:hypothetical protein